MKTPFEILQDFGLEHLCNDDGSNFIIAMKEYSKQWVKEALKNEPDSFIEYYLKEIDKQ